MAGGVTDVLFRRGKVNGRENLWMMERPTGHVITRMKPLCDHDRGFICSHPSNTMYIMEFCSTCKEIRAYNTETKNGSIVFKGISVCGMCTGPNGTIFVVDFFGDIFQLEWKSKDRLSVIQGLPKLKISEGSMNKMCYLATINCIVVVSVKSCVEVISLSDGSCMWKLQKGVDGVYMQPCDVCSCPENNVLFVCSKNAKIFLFNNATGIILQMVDLGSEMKECYGLYWSNCKLVLLGQDKTDEKMSKVMSFSVHDEERNNEVTCF